MLGKILVVDDNRDMRILVRTILEDNNYEILEAPDGKSAIDNFRNGKRFDLVLLDIAMEPLDGFATLTAINQIVEKSKMPKVCFLTAIQSKDYVLRALHLGGDDYIVKPIDQMILLAKVKSLIGPENQKAKNEAFTSIRADFKAYIDSDFIIREISEYGLVIDSSNEIEEDSLINIYCPKLSEICRSSANSFSVRISKVKRKDNKYLIHCEFVGLSEESKSSIRSQAIQRRSSFGKKK